MSDSPEKYKDIAEIAAANRENEKAIEKLEEALLWPRKRTIHKQKGFDLLCFIQRNILNCLKRCFSLKRIMRWN